MTSVQIKTEFCNDRCYDDKRSNHNNRLEKSDKCLFQIILEKKITTEWNINEIIKKLYQGNVHLSSCSKNEESNVNHSSI